MNRVSLSNKVKSSGKKKAVRILYYMSFSMFFLFALIGMIGLNTILHEYSHKRDFQSIEPYDEAITVNIPLSFSDFYKTNGEYSFYYNLSQEEQVESISKYTELKAYSISGIIIIIFVLCFAMILFGERLIK